MTVSMTLGLFMVAGTLFYFGLAGQTLLYFAVFYVVFAQRRVALRPTIPSNALLAALAIDALAGTALTRAGLPGLMKLPWPQTLRILASAMVSCKIVNDAGKVVNDQVARAHLRGLTATC